MSAYIGELKSKLVSRNEKATLALIRELTETVTLKLREKSLDLVSCKLLRQRNKYCITITILYGVYIQRTAVHDLAM